MIYRHDRASGMIEEVLRRIDAEDVEDRVVNVAGAERMFFGSFAEAVGGTAGSVMATSVPAGTPRPTTGCSS